MRLGKGGGAAAETCTACETCVERCQVKAVQMEGDASVIAKDRCIGCGLCAITCPTGSITMVQKQTEEMSVIFENQDQLLQTMAKEKTRHIHFNNMQHFNRESWFCILS